MELIAIPGLPLVQPGDDLGVLIIGAMRSAGLTAQQHDVFVVAQKIVSKSENRYVDLGEVTPSPRAVELATQTGKDARLVEAILSQSSEVLRVREGLMIVRHKLGLVMANAGVDQSNIHHGAEQVLLLPADPDASSAGLRTTLVEHFTCELGVVISDSVGRAWRIGTVGLALGLAGVPAVLDRRGERDLYQRSLETTEVGFADQLASAAVLLMGEAAEATPVVIVRGLDWHATDDSADSLLRPAERDLFG